MAQQRLFQGMSGTFGGEHYYDAQPVPQASLDDLDLERVRAHIRSAREQLPRFDAPDDPITFLQGIVKLLAALDEDR